MAKSVANLDYKTSASLISLDFLGLVVVNIKEMLTGAATLVLPIMTLNMGGISDIDQVLDSYQLPSYARNSEAATIWLPVLLVDNACPADEPKVVAFKYESSTQSIGYWNTRASDANERLSKFICGFFSRLLNGVQLNQNVDLAKDCISCINNAKSGPLIYWYIMKDSKVLDSIASHPEMRVVHVLSAYRAYALIFHSGKYVHASLKKDIQGKFQDSDLVTLDCLVDYYKSGKTVQRNQLNVSTPEQYRKLFGLMRDQMTAQYPEIKIACRKRK